MWLLLSLLSSDEKAVREYLSYFLPIREASFETHKDLVCKTCREFVDQSWSGVRFMDHKTFASDDSSKNPWQRSISSFAKDSIDMMIPQQKKSSDRASQDEKDITNVFETRCDRAFSSSFATCCRQKSHILVGCCCTLLETVSSSSSIEADRKGTCITVFYERSERKNMSATSSSCEKDALWCFLFSPFVGSLVRSVHDYDHSQMDPLF